MYVHKCPFLRPSIRLFHSLKRLCKYSSQNIVIPDNVRLKLMFSYIFLNLTNKTLYCNLTFAMIIPSVCPGFEPEIPWFSNQLMDYYARGKTQVSLTSSKKRGCYKEQAPALAKSFCFRIKMSNLVHVSSQHTQ